MRKRYFRNYFGIIVGEEPVDVEIRVTADQVKYFRTLPLHKSQKEEPREGREFGLPLPHRPDLRFRAGDPLSRTGCGGAVAT